MLAVESTQPSNVLVEQAFLGALLLNADVLGLAKELKAEFFSEPLHQQIFSVCRDRAEAGEAVTAIAIAHYFAGYEPIGDEKIPVPLYIARLAGGATTVINAAGYARLITELAARRTLQQIGKILIEQPSCLDVGVRAIMGDTANLLTEVEGMSARAGTTWTPDLALEYCLASCDRPIITTGLTALDAQLGGCQPGMFTIVAGRPGMGKTVFAVSVARAAAKAENYTLVFSLEMAYRAMWARFLADESWNNQSPIWYGSILRGKVKSHDRPRLLQAHADLKKYPFEIVSQPGLTVGQIAMKCRQTAERLRRDGRALKLVVIDHLGNINPGDRYMGSKVNEIGGISNGLRDLCINLGDEYGTALVAFSQVNRGVEHASAGEEKIPSLHDLRDSGHLEQDARIVLGLYRPAYYLEQALKRANGAEKELIREKLIRTENEYQIHLLKNDSGSVGMVECSADVRCSSVRNAGVCKTNYYENEV